MVVYMDPLGNRISSALNLEVRLKPYSLSLEAQTPDSNS